MIIEASIVASIALAWAWGYMIGKPFPPADFWSQLVADLNNLQAVITTAQNAYQSTKATHAAAIAAAAAAATDNSAKLAALDSAQAAFDEAIASVRVHLIPDPDSTWGKTK